MQEDTNDRMLEKILVPLDGSPLGERALPVVLALARAAGGRLRLFRAVLSEPIPGTETPEAEAAEDELLRDAEGYLNRLSEQISERGVHVELGVRGYGLSLRGEEVAGLIVEEARRSGAGLIGIATHGRSGLGRWVYGSVAEGVLRHAPLPVLLVRSWQPGTAEADPEERPRVLVPLDGSALAEEALPVAERLADALAGELILLRAVPPPDLVPGPDRLMEPWLGEALQDLETTARTYMEGIHNRYAADDRQVATVVEVGDPVQVIVYASREHGAGLVVMTTHGMTGLTSLMFGSVAAGVLRQGTTPLVVARPRERAEGGSGGSAGA